MTRQSQNDIKIGKSQKSQKSLTPTNACDPWPFQILKLVRLGCSLKQVNVIHVSSRAADL